MRRRLLLLGLAVVVANGCAETDSDPTLGAVDGAGLDGVTTKDAPPDSVGVSDSGDTAGPGDSDIGQQPEIAADTPGSTDSSGDGSPVDVSGDIGYGDTSAANDTSADVGVSEDTPDGIQGDGALGDASLGDIEGPDASPADTAPEADIGAPSADTLTEDTPNDAASDASAGCPGAPECFLPQAGAPDAPVNQPTGAAPTLAGGAKPEGWYALEEIDIYTDGTFNGLVTSVQVSSNGNTFGSIEVVGDAWGISANLDLALSVQPLIGEPIAQSFAFTLSGGGCFVLAAGTIEADLLQCGGSFANGVAPPGSFPYESASGTLAVMVTIDQATILNLLPAEYQDLAGLALAGDLPMVLRFSTP